MKKIIILLSVLLAGTGFSVELSVQTIFSDHMVLQREQSVPVWGTADAGAEITVEFAGQVKTAIADSSNHWNVVLDPMPASYEPRVLQVSSFEFQVSFSDVLVGEVWLCSGQSNMYLPLYRTEDGDAVVAAADHPQIRLYHTPWVASQEPVEVIDSAWKVCTPLNVKYFSGVAYYFGRKLHQDLSVPIGLIGSNWGSTKIEPWTPPCGFEGIDSLSNILEQVENMPEMTGDPAIDRQVPSAVYNGMIHAHIPYAMRGAIWYQGEANTSDGMLYVDKTKALLEGWRSLWGNDFPFYFVQLAPYQYDWGGPDLLPLFWEAQSAIVKTIHGTGMAVISDAATPDNIHPSNKEAPGTRLALLAEDKTYGMDVVSSGPVFQTLEKQGDELIVTFTNATGLTTRDGLAPDWFEIAGADGVYEAADAQISSNTAILQSSLVPAPTAVRFAWHEEAMPNLMNGAGLPAPCFRAQLSKELVGSFQLHGALEETARLYYDNLNTRISGGTDGTAGVVLGSIDVLTGENPMSSSPPLVQRYSSTSIFQQLSRYQGHPALIAFDYDLSSYLSTHPAGTSFGQYAYTMHLEYSNRRLSSGADLNILLSYSDGSTITLDPTDIGGGVDIIAGDGAAMNALAADTGKYVFLGKHVANSTEAGTISIDITSYIAASIDGKVRVLLHDEGEYKTGLNIQNGSGIVADRVSATPFEAWTAGYYLSGSDAQSTADPDGDGISNLCEFGLGGNPTNSADQGISPSYSVASGLMTYVYLQRLNSDLTYYLETCTNLVSGIWVSSGYTVSGSENINTDFRVVTNQISPETEKAQFVRLVIED